MADRDNKPGSREGRIAADTSIAKHVAGDFGGSPQHPIVDAPVEPAGVTAKITGLPLFARPGTVSGQLVVENRGPVDLEVVSSNLYMEPSTAGVISQPFVSGPQSPAIRLDAGDLAVLGPVCWTIHPSGIFKLGATVRLRERGAAAGVPLEHVEADPVPVTITPIP